MNAPGTGLHKIPSKSKRVQRKGDARFYDPPVVCAKRGCHERLTIAAVLGGSKHCSRACAGFGVAPPPRGPRPRGEDATDASTPDHPMGKEKCGDWSAGGGRPSERFVLLLPMPKTMPTETTLTVTEATRILGLSDPTYTYRLLRVGTLVGRRVGGRWLVDAASVEQRKQRMDQAARSKANAAAERERRKAEIRQRYAKP